VVFQCFIEAVFSIVRLAPSSKYLNVKNGSGMTPLHLAVVGSHPWAIRRLVIAGCNVTARDRRGNTALHLACELGDVNAVRCLMQPVTPHEASVCPRPPPPPATHHDLPQDLELRNDAGQTCLHLAAVNGHFAVVQLLVVYGVDVNVVECAAGKTALHACAEAGNFEMCEFLVRDCGADADVETWAGRTPADVAMEAGHVGLAEVLVQLGSDLTPPEVFDTDDDDDESEDECDEGRASEELPRV
jgi:ankyrin repeat protein